MESKQPRKLWPWIVGGVGLLVVMVCGLGAVIGGGTLLASQAAKKAQSASQPLPSDMTAKNAALQNLQGWVEVSSASGEWTAAADNQLLTAGQHVRTGKLSSADLIFYDGSKAVLKADSEISLDELNAPKKGRTRTILMTQVSGESTHKVASNKEKGSRYEVSTSSGAGTAKGTEFEVVVTPQQTAYYYVTEGVVAVTAVETTVLVNPGYMTVLYTNQPPIEPVKTVSVEGLVSQTGSQWTVAGTTFIANDATIVTGNPQVGDWVAVEGHLNENNQNVADQVTLLRSAVTNRFNLTGPVEAMDAGQWKINGQAILVTDATQKDGDIKVGSTVYAQGVIETSGALRAESITLVNEETAPFSFSGVVQEIADGQWKISGVSISVNETTALAEGIKAGDMVQVEGRIQSDGAWLAQKITLVSQSGSTFSFTGKLESQTPWKVAGISFETGEDAIISSDLHVGDLVRVEGAINADGVWVAARIDKIDTETSAKMVLIGTVISKAPWVVNGVTFTLAPDVTVDEKIVAGTLVRVELVMTGGAWQAGKIEPIVTMVWTPGCFDVAATVVSLNGSQIQLANWPVMTVASDATVEGQLAANSVVHVKVCFDAAMQIKITSIVIVQQAPGTNENNDENDDEDEQASASNDGGKVMVCHKPGKKGGHTLSISRSALPAHLGHGDYAGACR